MGHSVIVLTVIALYIGFLLTISHFTSRKADNSTFFIGNKKMAWPIVGLAMITAPISGVTFISVPGMVLTKGYGYLQMCLGFIVGYLVIGWLLVPIYYKHNIVSIYSFLESRFGKETYKTGAWFFLISKILGTAVKFLVVCTVLQLLVFNEFGVPFVVNVVVTTFLIFLYTFKGGVRTVVWTDLFKSVCLVVSTGIMIYFIADTLHWSGNDIYDGFSNEISSRMFFFDDSADSSFFWKQFIAGIFLVVAMTGMDQDMMQHTLSCRNAISSKKNLVMSSILQFLVISLFLMLGTLIISYANSYSMSVPANSDDLLAMVAFHESMPWIVGVAFILGLIAASYSSVGSALTSLTTSYTVDILEADKKYDETGIKNVRKKVHIGMAMILAIIIMGFYYVKDDDAISAVFTLASYTYGPILGLFIFGIFTKREVNARLVALICFLSPVISWAIQWYCKNFLQYQIGFELLLINASLILIALYLLPHKEVEYEAA